MGQGKQRWGKQFVIGVLLALPAFFQATAYGDRYTSPSYTIDASSTGDSIAGQQTSASYQLTSSGGASVVGNAASGSYKLTQGYVAQLEQSIELSLSPSTLAIGNVTPNTSNAFDFTTSVLTDAPGYTLAVAQNNDLTSSGNTIPGVSGSIASPVTWSEGSTKGLGFSMVSTNATSLPGKWGAGAAYAAFPGSSTSFYTRTGLSGGTTDTHNMRVRLDVAVSQPAGNYTNTATWTGTTTP